MQNLASLFDTKLVTFVALYQIKFNWVYILSIWPERPGSIPSCVIPKTQKMVLDTSLLNTQHYKVGIKGKVEQSRERNSALPYTSV